MLKDLRHTAKHIVIYSIGNLSTKLIGFILLPLYTDYLTTDEYGMLAILEVTSFMLIALVGMRMSTAMMRWGSAEKSSSRQGSIAFTVFVTILVMGIIFNLLFQPLAGSFSQVLFESKSFKDYFRVLFLFVSFEMLNVWVLDLIRIKEKPLFFVFLSLVKFTVVLGLNIYFIKYLELGVLGIILSQLIGSVLLFLGSLVFISKNVTAKFLFKEIKPMFGYGFPLVFTTISMYLLSLGDRYLMKYMLDLGEVGIYSLGYKIAMVTNLLVIQSFQTGFLPIAYKKYEEGGNERFFVKSLTYYTYILVIISLGLAMVSKELIHMLSRSEAYYSAYVVVPFISLALIFKGIQYVFSLSLHFVRNTKYNAFIVLSVAIFNLLLNYILLPRIGIYGAGVASMISFFIMLLLFRVYARRFYDPGYEIKRIITLIVTGISFYLVSTLFNEFSMVWSLLLKILLLFLFPLVLLLFGFYEEVERSSIRGFFKKWYNPIYWSRNIRSFLKS